MLMLSFSTVKLDRKRAVDPFNLPSCVFLYEVLKRPDVSTDEWRSFKAGKSFVYIRYVQKSAGYSVSGETTQK